MKTPVNFELAKLLKEKGYNENGCLQEVWLGNKYEWRGKGKNKKSVEIPVFGLGSSSVLPTIAEVVMWLYEKHEIFIQLFPIGEDGKMKFYSKIIVNDNGWVKIKHQISTIVNLPTEAYEAAIDYTLKNLIK